MATVITILYLPFHRHQNRVPYSSMPRPLNVSTAPILLGSPNLKVTIEHRVKSGGRRRIHSFQTLHKFSNTVSYSTEYSFSDTH